MDEDFDFNETATAPATHQEFLMENLCFKAGKPQGSYTPPATRSASTRWKRLHEQSMMLRLDEMHVIKKQNAQLSKDAARKIIRKIPVEILAREWLSKEDATVDMRAFLVDQVLPTLILGVERLLKEVDEKGLSASNVYQTEFNPINFLAQYLMRNNPRFSNFAEASPYVRGLREVSEEIKQELFTFEDNRLARIKAEARRKRQEREKLEQQIREERDRRQQQLIVQFQEWNVPTDNNRVELSLLQNALRSFAEIAEQLPSELREVAKFGHALEPTDETGRTLAVKEFAQYISMFVEDLPIEVFEQFMVHMSKCAAAHRAAAERENRRIILTNLFLLCDHGGLGLLDRHRILSLFEQFWDLARETKEPKGTLRNPRKWPVIEVDEVDDIMFEAFEEEGDGGLTEHEAIVAAQQLSKVQTKLNKQAADSAVNDKAALEKWKMEQLSEKSEGTAQEGDVDDKTVLGETEAETEAQQVEDAGQKKEEEEEPASEVTQAEETKDETAEQQGDAVDASTADSASAPAKDDAETKTDDSAEKKDAEKPESGEKASSVEKVEGETGTDDNTAAGQEEGTSGDVTINMAANGAKEAGETEKEQAQGEGEKEKDETEMGDEDLDVDITAELAGDGSKSALKRIDPVTGATATGRASVTFAGNTAFDRERTGITTNSRSQSQMSAFDESVLNVSQFVQLTETFLGHDPIHDLFTRLVHYLKEGYEETEEEKMERLVKARKEAISAKRKLLMDNLFEKWDNDGSGFLEMEDVQEVMFRYKDGQEIDSIKRAQTNMKRKSKYHDARLSKREFRQFVELVADELPGAESFESFVEFLTNSVERSYAERIRGEARKKWLSQIVKASQVSGTSLEPVYKAVFQALYKDAETHGGEKHISSSISMLERNTVEPARGDLLLRYAACTPEDCEYMLGKALFKNMKGISFQCVDSGKPIHVPRVANHGNVYFWNYDRMPDDREGSFMVCPLKDRKKRVFGLLGIDTLNDPHKKAIFITHEIQFFQGVAKAFSIAYHNVDMRKKLLRITESAISWIQRRCPHIAEINVYMVEPAKGGTPSEDGGEGTTGSGGAVLRKMMTTDKKGQALPITDIIRLERKDNLFRDYLFKCMDNSETVTADAYGERHTASPLRDNEGKAIGVVDISIGDMRRLPPYENKEAQRMLRLLQMAHREITKEADGDETTRVLEAEKDDAGRMDIMFDRLMLMELRENVARLDPQSFAELKSYHEPPRVIHDIIRAALAVFNVEKAGEGGYDDWNIAKTFINNDLVQQIKTYDPTVSAELIKSDVVEKFLKAVPHGEVGKYGSIPAQQLYNWVFVCISLIEHTRKMRENAEGNVLVSAGEGGGASNRGSPSSRPTSGGTKKA